MAVVLPVNVRQVSLSNLHCITTQAPEHSGAFFYVWRCPMGRDFSGLEKMSYGTVCIVRPTVINEGTMQETE